MARTRSSLASAIPPRSMHGARHPVALRHSRAFGRARRYQVAVAQPPARLNDDLRQFMMTFIGGLVFVTVFIA